jgi:hypothetical protein
VLRNEPFVPKYDPITGCEHGQPITDDPRLGRLVKTQLHPHHTFRVKEVRRWSDGAERFTVVPVNGSDEQYGPATMFTFID